MIFFNKFKCKHHFEWLCVEKEQTIKQKDDMYEIITYHLHCEKCFNDNGFISLSKEEIELIFKAIKFIHVEHCSSDLKTKESITQISEMQKLLLLNERIKNVKAEAKQ